MNNHSSNNWCLTGKELEYMLSFLDWEKEKLNIYSREIDNLIQLLPYSEENKDEYNRIVYWEIVKFADRLSQVLLMKRIISQNINFG